MKTTGIFSAILAVVMMGTAAVSLADDTSGRNSQPAAQMLDIAPAVFVENQGQRDRQVSYRFEGNGGAILFSRGCLAFDLAGFPGGRPEAQATQVKFRVRFRGAEAVEPVGALPTGAVINYYSGADPAQWRMGVPAFGKVVYSGIYEGVDLHVWGKRSGLKYEFHCAPGDAWRRIVVAYEGIDGLSIDEHGVLHAKTALGEVVDKAPLVYQDTPQGRVEIPAAYRLADGNSYAFEITGPYDKSLPLVVDPDLAWGTYFGMTSSEDRIRCEFIGIDDQGRVMVARTPWLGAPGDAKVEVTQFAESGTLLWRTYLNGSGEDGLSGASFGHDGSAYLVGQTNSTDFPVVNAFQNTNAGGYDFFVAKVAPDGQVAYASYLGGSGDETMYPYGRPRPTVTNATGDIFIMGRTYSSDLPTPNGFCDTLTGTCDFFVARVTASGQLAWASYLPSVTTTFDDKMDRLTTDDDGNAFLMVKSAGGGWPTPNAISTEPNNGYLAKITPSGEMAWGTYLHSAVIARALPDGEGGLFAAGVAGADFPTVNAFQATFGGATDAFVARLTPAGALAWSSFLGGSGLEVVYSMVLDQSGNLIVAGATSSNDFPTPNGFDTSYNGGGQDIFIAKVTPDGELAWASYLGSALDAGTEYPDSVATDPSGNVFVAFVTSLGDYPTQGGFDNSIAGHDVYVARVTSSGEFSWGTYLGGTDPDEYSYETLDFLGADAAGNATLVGRTYASDFPLKDAIQGYAGGTDCFITKIEPDGQLLWSTCLGGADDEWVRHEAYTRWSNAVLGADGSVTLLGPTRSADFPTPNGYDTTFNGFNPSTTSTTMFVAKIAGKLTVATISLPDGVEGTAYSQALSAMGGQPPLTWAVSAGSLPAGLTLDSASGVISGVPTSVGKELFTVTVTDSEMPAATALRGLSIVINDDSGNKGAIVVVGPGNGSATTADAPPAFEFTCDPGARVTYIEFSTSEDFAAAPAAAGSRKARIVRFPIKAYTFEWTPTAGQWKVLKKLAGLEDRIYWRFTGKLVGGNKVYAQTRELLFNTGDITNLSVTPSHLSGTDEAVWPALDTPPTFQWTNNTKGMKYFWVDISTDDQVPLGKGSVTLTCGGSGIQNTSQCLLKKAQWKSVRKLAGRNGGALYWRVRAKDAEKALSCVSETKKLIVDGGEWTLSDLDLGAASPSVSWTCSAQGEGIDSFRIQFSTTGTFPSRGGLTIAVPSKAVSGSSYTFSDKEVTALGKFAQRKKVTTLYYRVRGEDADKAFVTYSGAKTTSAP